MPSSAARPPKRRAVADARRHGDHRHRDQPADHARQRAFHPGDDDDDARAARADRAAARSRWSPATPTSIEPLDGVPERLGDDRGLLRDREVARARRRPRGSVAAVGDGGASPAARECTVRASAFQPAAEARPRAPPRLARASRVPRKPPLAASSRSQIATTCSGGLALAEDHLGLPLAERAMVVDAGECEGLRTGGGAAGRSPRRARAARRRRRRAGPRAARLSRHRGDRLEVLEEDRFGLRDRLDLERGAGAGRSRRAVPWCTSRGACGTRSRVLRVSPWSRSASRACSSATANRSAGVGRRRHRPAREQRPRRRGRATDCRTRRARS